MVKKEAKGRIVLVPALGQGHVIAFMQLGKALNLKGFSITVVQGKFNQVSSSSQHCPGFQFVTIPESLPESDFERLGPTEFILKLNKTSETSFKDCIGQLLMQRSDIACIIYDELMYFCGAAAREFEIPSVIFGTVSATNQVSHCVLSKLNAEKFLVDMEDPNVQDKVVENLHPLRYKDLPTLGMEPLERFFQLCIEKTNISTASGLIVNTATCLESSSLTRMHQEFGVPVYPLGPLHIRVAQALRKAQSRGESLNSFIFSVNFQFPSKEPHSLVFYFASEDPIPSYSLLHRLINGGEDDGSFCNQRFKRKSDRIP